MCRPTCVAFKGRAYVAFGDECVFKGRACVLRAAHVLRLGMSVCHLISSVANKDL